MRTYDPADRITYVHLGQERAEPTAPPQPRDECHRLPAGYANASLRDRLGEPLPAGTRPPLVLLRGGAGGTGGPAPAAPALRLAR
ncbi:hypothetical protein [Geodermatophilus sp. SYSU D00815]